MDYMSLTNEEIMEAIQKARDYAEKNGKGLTITAIEGALSVYLEEKEKAKEEVQEVAPVTATPEVPVVETTEEIKPEEVSIDSNAFYRNNVSIRNSLEEEVNNILGRLNRDLFIPLNNILSFARRGELGPEYFNKYGNVFNSITEPNRSRLKEIILNLNSLARENYYAHFKESSPEVLEVEKNNAIRSYKALKEKGEERRRIADSRKLWNHESATVTVDEMAKTYENGDRVLRHYGIEPYSVDGQLFFSPQSYDNVYYVVDSFLLPTENFYNKRLFDESAAKVESMISGLENMSIEEFRNYKLSLMELTPEEKQVFEQHIADYGMANKEEMGGQRK